MIMGKKQPSDKEESHLFSLLPKKKRMRHTHRVVH